MGFAIAKALAEAGADVVIHGRTVEHVNAAKSRLENESSNAQRLRGVAADLADPIAVDQLIHEVGDVDVLVSGGGPTEAKPFFALTDEDWDRFIRIYLLAPVRLARHFGKHMVEKGWGRLLFNAHVVSGLQQAEMVHWGTVKTGLLGLSRGLAESVAGSGVTVNAFVPGPTHTEESFMTRAPKWWKNVQTDREGVLRGPALDVAVATVHAPERGGKSRAGPGIGSGFRHHGRGPSSRRRHHPIAALNRSFLTW